MFLYGQFVWKKNPSRKSYAALDLMEFTVCETIKMSLHIPIDEYVNSDCTNWKSKICLFTTNMLNLFYFLCFFSTCVFQTILIFQIQLISYKRFLECTLIQWRLSIYPYCTQVAEATFFMKSLEANFTFRWNMFVVVYECSGRSAGSRDQLSQANSELRIIENRQDFKDIFIKIFV